MFSKVIIGTGKSTKRQDVAEKLTENLPKSLYTTPTPLCTGSISNNGSINAIVNTKGILISIFTAYDKGWNIFL